MLSIHGLISAYEIFVNLLDIGVPLGQDPYLVLDGGVPYLSAIQLCADPSTSASIKRCILILFYVSHGF